MMHDAYRLGTLYVQPSNRRISSAAAEVTVSPRAIGVLESLRRAGTTVMSRDALLEAVWPDVIVTDESLTQAVAELRRAFQKLGGDRDLVMTIPKGGYRLREAPVPCRAGETSAITIGPAISMEAYCLVLQAHTELVRADDDAMPRAVALGREAVGLSPGSALAHATYSIMLMHEGLYAGVGRSNFAPALEHAETAVRLAPKSSIAHASLGFAIGAPGAGRAASNSLMQAMLLNDSNGEAHYLAARVAFVSGDHRAANTFAMRAAERVSDPSRPLFLAARAAQGYDPEGSVTIAKRCVAALRRRMDYDPDEPRSHHTLGPALALAGDHAQAWEIIANQARDRSICAVHDFFGYAHIGDNKRALESLENALDEGFRDHRWLTREPMLVNLRKERGFQRLTSPLKVA